MRVASEGVARAGIAPGSDMRIDMAWRDHVGKVYTLA